MPASFMGYLFVPGPFGDLKCVSGDVFGHSDPIGSFLKNICGESENRLFSEGRARVLGQK